jgi:uncharacterized protein (TIGR02001 family)
MKKLLVVLALMATASVAQAQVSGNAGLVSDYRFRGISQSQNALALQGGANYTHGSGVYVGNQNSTVSNRVYNDSTGLEMDVYGGYKMEVAKGLKLDVGSYNYVYSQAGNKFGSNANTNELYVGVESGAFAVKYSRAISDYFGLANSKGTQYLQADANVPVTKLITANAHIGRTLVHNYSNRDYTDVKLGGTVNVQGFLVGAHYYTNLKKGAQVEALNTVDGQQLFKNTVVVSVSHAF